jgi:hypothetical protein
MKRSSRARIGATLSVSALSLALITGCSGGGSDDAKDNDKKADSKGSSAPAATVLNASALEKALVSKADLDGYTVEKTAGIPSKDGIVTTDEKCLPLAYTLSGLAPGDAKAEVSATVTQEPKTGNLDDNSSVEELADAFGSALDINVTLVGLSSYDGDGAQKTLASVQDAVKSCPKGFSATAEGETQPFTGIAEEKGSGTGDESVAFVASGLMDEEAGAGKVHVEVVRHGSTLATYYTINIGQMTQKKEYTVDPTVVAAQAKKLK